MSDALLMKLVRTIVTGDHAAVLNLLASGPSLAKAHFEQGATRQTAATYHIDEIGHYVYSGDTALHLAAAAYRHEIAKTLITMGANVRAKNRRGAEPSALRRRWHAWINCMEPSRTIGDHRLSDRVGRRSECQRQKRRNAATPRGTHALCRSR